jgi:hypothetical protein
MSVGLAPYDMKLYFQYAIALSNRSFISLRRAKSVPAAVLAVLA